MSKKYGKITTLEQFMNIALGFKFNTVNWESAYENFYKDQPDINSDYRETIDLFADTYDKMERINTFIENEPNAHKKAIAMAVRNVVFSMAEDSVINKLFYDTIAHHDEIVEESDISFDVQQKLAEKTTNIEELVNGRPSTKPVYEELNYYDKLRTCHKFMDMLLNSNFNMDSPYPDIVQTVFGKVKEEAVKISRAAAKEKGFTYKPADSRDKKAFNSLKDAAKTDPDFVNRVNGSDFFNGTPLGLNPNVNEVTLNLENTPIVDITAEQFLEKYRALERNELKLENAMLRPENSRPNLDELRAGFEPALSAAEIKWAETAVDNMVRSLYTDDQLAEMKQSGIDPLSCIMIDGKPVDPTAVENPETHQQDPLTMAKFKCGIVAKVLNGAKIDLCRFVPENDKPGYKLDKLVPVKTDLSMKTEKVSFWRRIKQLFGFDKSTRNLVEEANTKKRDYIVDPKNSVSMTNAQMNAATLEARQAQAEQDKHVEELDKILFQNNLYDEKTGTYKNIDNLLEYGSNKTEKDEKGREIYVDRDSYFRTMGRSSSRVNIAILYGLTRGYTLDQMLYGKDGVDRGQIGKEFIEEFSLPLYEEYIEKNGYEQNEESRKKYDDYILAQKDKVEQFYADAADAIMNIDIPPIDTDMSKGNIKEKIENLQKFELISHIAGDYVQVFEKLNPQKAAVDLTDPKKAASYARSEKLEVMATKKMGAVQMFGYPAIQYLTCLRSGALLDPDNYLDGGNTTRITIGAKSKACLDTFFKSGAFEKIGDVYDNGIETVALLNTLGSHCVVGCSTKAAYPGAPVYTAQNIKNIFDYLRAKEPDENLIVIDPADKTFTIDNVKEDINFIYKDILKSTNAAIKEYNDDLAKTLSDYEFDEKADLHILQEMNIAVSNEKIFGGDADEINLEDLENMVEIEISDNEEATEKTDILFDDDDLLEADNYGFGFEDEDNEVIDWEKEETSYDELNDGKEEKIDNNFRKTKEQTNELTLDMGSKK
ncbi:MAG: hypothetical protein ACI4J1_07670 [Ruminiclostridium sp.]